MRSCQQITAKLQLLLHSSMCPALEADRKYPVTGVRIKRHDAVLVLWTQVLVEGPNPKGKDGAGGTAFGRSRHNKLVFFDADGDALRGQLVVVRIDRVFAYSLYGAMVAVEEMRA